jgi:hypothetical protein
VPESSSVARKRKSKPTTPRRWKLQRVADRYAHAREDAQLAGLIPTVPEEALTDERVDPARQSEPPLLGLVRRAVREDWDTPAEKKPVIVDQIIRLVESEDTGPHVKVAAARTLQMLDRDQWERDQAERAGRAEAGIRADSQEVVVTADEAHAFLREIEKQTGQPIMSAAMLQVELDASRVMPADNTGGA